MEDGLFKTEVAEPDAAQDALTISMGDDIVSTAIGKPTEQLTDLRQLAMATSPENLKGALIDYQGRRETFREWLQSQLQVGVHYGVPPGCEPRGRSSDQWVTKPSLYKSGAELVVDLMGARDEYEADEATWQMMGAKAGMVVRKCKLYSRATGELLGEGSGSFTVGDKRMQANAALKMCDKRAKVAAVLNTWGLSDLFTQDLEEPDWLPEAHENPREASTPNVQGREDRVTREEGIALFQAWKKHQDPSLTNDVSTFRAWATGVIETDVNLSDSNNWTQDMVKRCYTALAEQEA